MKELCLENSFTITNNLFRQHHGRLYIWTSQNGNTRNQIDYILTQQRQKTYITSIKSLLGAHCDTDHQLLVANFKIN